jgi:gamma-glutamyl:cysteine ligase YbdK (ATP-grasp superfamily)
MSDLQTGAQTPTCERLEALFAELSPEAGRLGCEGELAHALGMLDESGAERQRAVAAERGLQGLAAWLADSFSG